MTIRFWFKITLAFFLTAFLFAGFFFNTPRAQAVDSTLPGKLKYASIYEFAWPNSESWYVRSAVQNGILMPTKDLSGNWLFHPEQIMMESDISCALYRANNGYVDCPSYSSESKRTWATYGWFKTQLSPFELPKGYSGAPADDSTVTKYAAAAYITWNKNKNVSWYVQATLKKYATASGADPHCDPALDNTEVHYKDQNGIDNFVLTAKNVYNGTTFDCTKVNQTVDSPIKDARVLFNSYRIFLEKPGLVEDEFREWGLSFIRISEWKEYKTFGINPNKIVLYGDLYFATPDGKGTMCSSDDLAKLVDTQVIVQDATNGAQLGKSWTSLGTDGVPEYWLFINKATGGHYKIKTEKADFLFQDTSFDTTSKRQVDILARPLVTHLSGRVYDGRSRLPVSNVLLIAGDARDLSDFFGGYQLLIPNSTYESSVRILPPQDSAYSPDVKSVSTVCPTAGFNVAMSKKAACDRPGGKNVEICWYGDYAISLKNDPAYSTNWLDLATTVADLRTKTGSSGPSKLSILSTADRPEAWAWASRLDLSITFDVEVVSDETHPFSQFILVVIPHEFGHTLQFTSNSYSAISDQFFALLGDGYRLVTPGQSKTEVFRILTPSWNYYTAYADGAVGYAGTNELELFAESFAAMYRFDSKMHTKIADTTYPADLRAYAKKVHNASAPYWSHGNTISLEELKSEFALK